MRAGQRAERLRDLPLRVVRLASLTTTAVAAGTEALVEGDVAAAQRVIDDDDAVDSLRHSIEDECLELLGTGRLTGVDLRFVAGTLRVAHELERSADLMVNVAKTTWRLHEQPLDATSRRIVERMGRQAAVQLRVAVNAFADRDCSWASALADMDEAMDDLEGSLFRHILRAGASETGTTATATSPEDASPEDASPEDASPEDASPEDASLVGAVQLGLVARHYERIGDHAVTIAEQVSLVVSGERAPRRRRTRVPVAT